MNYQALHLLLNSIQGKAYVVRQIRFIFDWQESDHGSVRVDAAALSLQSCSRKRHHLYEQGGFSKLRR